VDVLVIGSNGFIGAAVAAELVNRRISVRGVVRSLTSRFDGVRVEEVSVGAIGPQTDWSKALAGVGCIIHCAGSSQALYEIGADGIAAYRRANVDGSRRLAEQAAAEGVRRLVYLSSIKVNGASTEGLLHPFGPPKEGKLEVTSPTADLYGASKWEAEQALWAVSAKTGLEVVVVRPPLVYGPGVKGNMLRLLRWVDQGLPLPLGAVRNQRSMVGISNLVDLLVRCIDHPDASGQTFLVSDGHDLSTPQLIRLAAEGMGRPLRLVSVPVAMLKIGGFLLARREQIGRLVNSLQVDSGHVRTKLGWTPPVSVEDGVREMAKWYAELQDVELW
jgi:nucleoside-diphosphate-sugar epimerase